MLDKIKVIFASALLMQTAFFYSDVQAKDDPELLNVPAIVIEADKSEVKDHFEGVNRGVYQFNDFLDNLFLEPVARGYRSIVPEYGRERVDNVLKNISLPVVFLNNLLQADFGGALDTFWRFTLNTTLGVGGLFDFAGEAGGIEYKEEDFGQTLGKYGVGGGSYIVLPLLGPSTVRDTFGRIVDALTNPFNYIGGYAVAGIRGTEAIHDREGVLDTTDEIDRTSFDPYATIRSAYIQRRASQIADEQ